MVSKCWKNLNKINQKRWSFVSWNFEITQNLTLRSFQNKGFECSNIPVSFALQDSLCMSSQKLMYELTAKGQCSLVLHENKSLLLTDCDLQFLGGLCTLQSSFHDRGVKSILGFDERACLQDRRRQDELIMHMFFLLFYEAALNLEIKMFWSF